MVETTRQTDYKRKQLDVDKEGNLVQRGTKILKLKAKDLHNHVEEKSGLGTIARAYEQATLEYDDNERIIIQSGPRDAEELEYAMAEFAKYKTLNKIKDDVRKQIDKLEAEKRTFMSNYEQRRKQYWRAFYKAKEEAEGKEKELDKLKDATYDPDYERKMRMEFGFDKITDEQ